MRLRARCWGRGTLLALVAVVMLVVGLPSSAAGTGKKFPPQGAMHVRWDIIKLTTPGGVTTVNAGGVASAKAPDATMITLTGSGTFVAPAGKNVASSAATGGGTWTTSDGHSGTYKVNGLVSWAFANLQSPGLGDTIADPTTRANGTAVLRIQFSDGQSGVLTVGCHGPGAPPGIFEGIATTKAFKTYYDVQAPGADPNANRTIFHIRR
jgi:hypothetical protein